MDKNFDKTTNDILKTDGIQSKGFGIVPKLVMQDKRLTIQAKAIYAYFCSYAGNGTTAFPSRSKILFDLGISKDTYYKHFNLLKQYGYIKVEQQHQGGKLSRNIYTLMQTVALSDADSKSFKPTPEFSPASAANPSPAPDQRDAADQCPTISDAVQCPASQCTENQCPKIQDTNNNNSMQYKQNHNSISQSCQSMTDGTDRKETVTVDTVENYVDLIKTNISYDDFKITHPHNMDMVNELVCVILDAVFTESRTIRINGEEKHRELVKSMLLKLDYWHIVDVLDKYKSLTARVRNKHAYLLSMLYNTKMEYGTGIHNQVQCDMREMTGNWC